MRSGKGFSLVELIIVIAILGVILTVSFNLMLFGVNAHKRTVKEYDIQSSMRTASERTNDVIKYSSSLYTVPEGIFREDNLDKEWYYIGLSEDSKEIIYYEPKSESSTEQPKFHKRTILVANQDNIKYDFVFTKRDDITSSNLLEFTIEGFYEDNKSKKITIDTMLSAINSGSITHSGTEVNLAKAVSFQKEMFNSKPPQKNNVGTITMVLDVSGSMGNKLEGSTSDKDNKKINLLKTSAAKIVDGFCAEKNLELILSIVPFSTSANYPTPTSKSSNQDHPFYKLEDQAQVDSLKSKIGNLTANGGTNTGDGLRRAYYNTVSKNNALRAAGKNPKNYLIVLVDGVSTYASVRNGGYFESSGYLSDHTKRNSGTFNGLGIMGNGSSLDKYATDYVTLMGKKGINDKLYEKVYVIGFSSKKNELESVNDIAEALGIKNPETSENVFRFTNTDFTLEGVFESIREDIIQQIWRAQGPKF